jgi:prophage regulatory protein
MKAFAALHAVPSPPILSLAAALRPGCWRQEMPNRIVRLRTVIDRTGLSRSTIYRKVAEGTFPPQHKLGSHAAGWSEAEIDRWVANPPAYRPDASS